MYCAEIESSYRFHDMDRLRVRFGSGGGGAVSTLVRPYIIRYNI